MAFNNSLNESETKKQFHHAVDFKCEICKEKKIKKSNVFYQYI